MEELSKQAHDNQASNDGHRSSAGQPLNVSWLNGEEVEMDTESARYGWHSLYSLQRPRYAIRHLATLLYRPLAAQMSP